MSLKNLLIKNSFTYKIYIYYNLYIRHKAHKIRRQYSQWGEDLVIENFFKNKEKGFYVDIGCFHPVFYNNTCLLYNKGWAGINIDLNQTSIDLFNIVRPNDHNICAAVAEEVQEYDLFFDNAFSPVNTINKSYYESSNKKIAFKKLSKQKVVTKKFTDLMEDISNIPSINFLNIDCEGHDYSVLKSFNLKYYKPELVCIETHDSNNAETFYYKNIINLLNENGYTFLKKCGLSSIFILK